MGSYSYSPGAVACRTIIVVLALMTVELATTQAHAQGDLVPSSDPQMPFTEAYNSGCNYRGTAIRMSYKSSAYGLHNDQFSLGLQNRRRTGDGVLMLDGQYDLSLEESGIMGLNVGLGRRWLYQSSFGETARIFGASFWYDGTNSEIDNMLNQVGVSLESLGEIWDFRVNANLPVGTTRQDGTGVPTGEISYFGYYLSEMTLIPIDQAVGVVDFEVARRIGHHNIWAWAGGYSLWEDDTDDSAFGGKAGVRGYLYDDLLLQLAVTSDKMFDTKVTFSLIWYPGRSSRRCRARHDIDDRMMEPVIRNNYIALKRDYKDGANLLEYDMDVFNETDVPIRVVHIDSNATAPGDGSFESPFTSLGSIDGGSQARDIILVHSGTAYSEQQVVLLDNQRLLGEGLDIRHSVDVKDLGPTNLPASSTGALAGLIPIITNTTDVDVVTLGSAPTSREFDDDSVTSTNEVNNLKIVGGDRGIVSVAGVGISQATIKNMTIESTTGNGIELTPFVETTVQADDSETKQVLFSPTIDTVTLTNIGGDGINLDATTTEPDITPVTESINLISINSTDGTGQGVSITNNKSTATIDNFSGNSGSAATSGGILFTNSTGGATIVDSTITGGAGTGISIVKDAGSAGDSTGSFIIGNTTITDTGEAAFHIDGGSSNVDFFGLISQNVNAAAVKIEGEHTGTVNFNEATTGTGVIAATAGTGLVFDEADGEYNFNHAVRFYAEDLGGNSIASVSTGIDIQNSDGTVTLSDALIENATTVAVRINGESANLDFTGQIVQTAAGAGAAVDISGEHTGIATFTEGATNSLQSGNGVIVATYGDGLQFDDADGSYSFNDPVSLNGTGTNMTAGINITSVAGGSSGFFTFSDTRITDIGGTAFNLNGGTATVNFTGRIEQDDSANLAVNIGGNHTGTVTFNEATLNEGVIMASTGAGLTFNGADGTYNFNHAVELSGTAGIDITDSDGTITFSDDTATVTNSSITALHIDGGEADVNFFGLIKQTLNNALAVHVEGGHTGTVNFSESSAGGGVVEASMGGGLLFNGADGTYNFNDAVTLSGTTAVVNIDGSDGSFTFDSDSSINYSGTGTAFTVNNGEAVVTYSGDITSTGGRPVEITSNSGGLVTFGGTIDGSDEGILVQNNTGGTFQFNGPVVLATTTNTAVNLDTNTDATTTFSNLDITTTSGTGFNAVGGGIVRLTGSNNIVETTTGTGINMNGVEIAASGAAFKSVSVGSGGTGPTNGIKLVNVTGTGTFSVGSGGSSVGDGGTIQNTGGDGVSITNSARVSLNNMLITSTTGDGVNMTHDNAAAFNVTIANCNINTTTGEGIFLNSTGAGSMRLTLNDNDVSHAGAEQAVALTVGAGGGTTYISLNDNNFANTRATAGSDQEALLLTVNGGTCAFEADGNSFSSNDEEASFDIQANDSSTLNATVHGNTFTNGDTTGGSTARGLWIASNDNSAVNLSLLDNSASAASGEEPFLLSENDGSTFGVVLLTTPNPSQPKQPDEDFKTPDANMRNGGTYDHNATPPPDPETWVIEFDPDISNFTNLNEGDVPTP